MELLKFAQKKDYTDMERIQELYTQFVANSLQLDAIVENLSKLETDGASFEDLEQLYQNEFMLYMRHVAIYDDILLNIQRTPRTNENEFELAKIKKDSKAMLRVAIVEAD